MELKQQYVYIDDSGDPGFKLGGGSSNFFVLAAVVFDDWADAKEAEFILNDLKRFLGWNEDREFKFHKANDKQKSLYFYAIRKCKFRVYAIVIDKKRTAIREESKKDTIYSFVVKMLLGSIKGLTEANAFLDGSGNKDFRRRSTTKVRQIVNMEGHKIVRLRLRDSKNCILIQFADMIAGVIGAKFDMNKRFSNDWIQAISSQIIEIKVV